MTVNTGVKGQLAKLLATEDLIIEHKQCQTAAFNVDKRILTLPIWEKASENIYDLLVAHEVGHALFTPNVWPDCKCPQSFVNVTEDARIEKHIKRKYAGLPKTFYNGYQELDHLDFFEPKDKELEELGLIDRINLYYKVGAFTPIPFKNSEEESLCERVGLAESFEAACQLAEEIYTYMKMEKEKEQVPSPKEGEQDPDLDTPSYGSSQSDTDNKSELDSDSDSSDDQEAEEEQDTPDSIGGSAAGDRDHDMEAETDKSFNEKKKELVDHRDYRESVYVELPKFSKEDCVTSFSSVLKNNRNHFEVESRKPRETDSFYNDYEANAPSYDEQYATVEAEYTKFKKDSQKEVNYLVKEFECRKSASAYARATTSRTGVLDTRKLSTYKFNEDLFKKVTTIPNGKNHGMIFLLDWSGSMAECIMDTVQQVLQLSWFCQKVAIPFDVYAFTNDSYQMALRLDGRDPTVDLVPPVVGEFALKNDFSLVHLISSDAKKIDLEDSFKYLFFNTHCIHTRGYYFGTRFSCAPGMSLSGTPLNEAIVAIQSVIPAMLKKVEKLSLCILTDGESASCGYYTDRVSYNGDLYANCINQNCYLRDRKLGKTYSKMPYHPMHQTGVFLEHLRDKFPQVNVLGFRLIQGREVNSYLNNTLGWNSPEAEKAKVEYRKNKSTVLNALNYHQLYVLPTRNQDNTEYLDDLKDDATKAQITSAFKKTFKSKRSNKKILRSFIETVA